MLWLIIAMMVLMTIGKGLPMALSYLGLGKGLGIAAVFLKMAFLIWRSGRA